MSDRTARHYCYTDIECAPLDDAERWLPSFRHNAGTKDADKQAAQIAEKRAKALADAAVDPDLCRIVCVGSWWGHEEEPSCYLCRDENDEADALTLFWAAFVSMRERYPNTRLVGSNLLGFDLVVMVRRSLYLQVDVPHLERGKWRHADVIDLKALLCDDDWLPWRSLDYYCARFGLDVPHDAVDGAQIPALVAAGDWDAVRRHNEIDLLKVRALARRVVPALREVAA